MTQEEEPMHGFVGPDDGPEETVVSSENEAATDRARDARMSILRRLVHERWCDYEAAGACACEAGQALIDLIAIEREARVPAPLDVERLYPVLHEVGGEFCDPFTADHPAIMHASQAAAILARSNQPSTQPAQGGDK